MTTYYVDATLGADGNTGLSDAQAWQTIGKVNGETFNAGDSILFKRDETWTGTTLTISDSGSNGNRIIVGAYDSGADPIIERGGAMGSFTRVIVVTGNYVTVRDLQIQDAHEIGVRAEGTNINVINCGITDVGYGVQVRNTDSLVSQCNIHDLNMIVDDNLATDYGAVGVVHVANASNGEVEGCTLTNCRAVSQFFGFDGRAIEIFSASVNMSDFDFHNNWMEGCEGILEVSATGSPTLSNIQMWSNIVHDCFLGLTLRTDQATFVNFNLFANTIVETAQLNQGDSWSNFNNGASVSAISVYNNLIYLRAGADPASDFSRVWIWAEDATYLNNLYDHDLGAFAFPATHVLGASEHVGIASMVDIGMDDFHLQPDSPCRDNGTAMSLYRDYDDVVIPQGRGPDIGAYEYNYIPSSRYGYGDIQPIPFSGMRGRR